MRRKRTQNESREPCEKEVLYLKISECRKSCKCLKELGVEDGESIGVMMRSAKVKSRECQVKLEMYLEICYVVNGSAKLFLIKKKKRMKMVASYGSWAFFYI